MRRVLIAVLAALPLSIGVAATGAHGTGDGTGGGGGGTAHAVVAGTIVSVDPSTGTFVANAYLHGGDGGGGNGGGNDSADGGGAPVTTQVTITTDSTTRFRVGDQDATVSDLAPGQRFYALFSGSPGDPIQTLVSNPALGVFAQAESPPQTPKAAVGGTIVSVDTSSGTFIANAAVMSENSGGADAGDSTRSPTLTQVTIATDANTEFKLDGQSASLSDLAAGQRFYALFNGSPTDTLQTLVSNPALEVSAHAVRARHHRQLYAFVGSVTGVDTTAGTVTVDVQRSLPSGLVPAGSPPQTFTVGAGTLILGGSNTSLFGGTLGGVSVGDIVAGGLLAAPGQTLTQIESTPLAVLLDLPAGTLPSSHASSARAKAFNRTLSLLGVTSSTGHQTTTHKKSGERRSSKKRVSSRKHASGKRHAKSRLRH
jgi:hypothetical protein